MAENSDCVSDLIIKQYGRIDAKTIISIAGDRIKQRLILLEQIYNGFLENWKGVYLNPYLLREVVESYFCDVYRLKFFRPVNQINEHKKAAYTMKWISRVRPIQMHEGAAPTTATLYANAYFALMVGLVLMDVDFDPKSDKWWSSYITENTYLLHYHSVSVETLSSEMNVLQTMSATKNGASGVRFPGKDGDHGQ